MDSGAYDTESWVPYPPEKVQYLGHIDPCVLPPMEAADWESVFCPE